MMRRTLDGSLPNRATNLITWRFEARSVVACSCFLRSRVLRDSRRTEAGKTSAGKPIRE
jgi:hypothetical protein